ncbi:MAG: PIG-L family deacetylase [Chloroflexi bacterium]|nr:PIG-L family deacetylase [Chloroflexota bacterium]
MEETNKTIMIITAHPDDAEFSCGGSVARWAAEERDVIYVICTNGDKGSADPNMTSERLAQIRQEEQLGAAKTLGVKEVIFLGHPDGGLEDTPTFRGELVRLIRKYRPDVVVTMDPWRRSFPMHRDHRIAATAALDAVFPYARDRLHYPEHMAEGLSPHKVGEVHLTGAENPDTFVDISETFSLKIAALKCHQSQISAIDELEGRMREMSARIGEPQGLALAEAFRRIQMRR